jgi:hypothetical protein
MFDINLSAEKLKESVLLWKKITVEVVEELYKAQSFYKRQGARLDTSCHNGTKFPTFESYLQYISLPKRTAYRWLERYVPEERKLLTPEELVQRQQIETRKKQDQATAIQKRVKEAIRTGVKPADWDDKTEKEFQQRLKDNEEREKRIQEAIEKEKELRDRRERERKDSESNWKKIEQEAGMFEGIVDQITQISKKRTTFKEKIRLSDSGGTDPFIDALLDYLEELDDDNRRIEACYNIIKVARGIASDLQRS